MTPPPTHPEPDPDAPSADAPPAGPAPFDATPAADDVFDRWGRGIGGNVIAGAVVLAIVVTCALPWLSITGRLATWWPALALAVAAMIGLVAAGMWLLERGR